MLERIKRYFPLTLKGMAMGAADVVPGVSGGTIAFISGIYAELLDSIRSIDHIAVKKLFKEGFASFWKHINGWFLLFLFTGIAISILSLSRLILYLLHNYPQLIWSFFFGLVIASAVYVAISIKSRDWKVLLAAIIGTGIAYYITIASPSEGSKTIWFVFITGAVAICAMILPGISGSFIMLLMGMYEFILQSLHELNILIIVTFMGGCAVGIISFSHLLSWLLKKYHDITVALLAGFMVGSLNKVWPWKEVIESRLIDGEEVVVKEANRLPAAFTEATGMPHYAIWCLLLMIFGFVLIFSLEKIAGKKSKLI
jgi:putative membrane protein